MEGVAMSTRPSLDRLKALDSLPDLRSQLAEANELCTHSARADMIAKWLLEKLGSGEEIRSNAEVWRSLYSTIRLVSPGRLATQLTSHNFLKTFHSAVEEGQQRDVLIALNDIISLLLEVSETPTGAPVRALLSVSAPQAASYLGYWFHNVRSFADPENQPSLLLSAFQIWGLTKSSTDENELFAKHCLVHASSLLAFLSTKDPEFTKKRKRDDEDADLKSNAIIGLETLLAKHIFLPARTAFFNAHDLVADQRNRHVGPQRPAFLIENMIEPLNILTVEENKEGLSQLGVLPPLLDVALRCVATPTPRQRTKERPWIETLFATLHQCNKHPTEGVKDKRALIDMLQVVGTRASLSRDTLQQIVRSCSLLAFRSRPDNSWGQGSFEDWELIAQVIKLDADLFTNPDLVEPLFTKITESSIKIAGPDPNDNPDPTQHVINSLRTLWSEKVVIPLVKAYGRSRNLLTFVHLWSEQLKKDQHEHIWSVWTELDTQFQSILEDSIAESEIVALFERLSKPIDETSMQVDTHENSTIPQNLGVNIIILNAILGGVHNEFLVKELAVRSEPLFSSLTKLFVENADAVGSTVAYSPKEKQIWGLMTNAFELWFPSWASEQTDATVVAERCSGLISPSILQNALSLARIMRSSPKATMLPTGETSSAECFVASVCYHLSTYEEHLQAELRLVLAETVQSLFQELNFDHPLAICRYPELMLFNLNGQTRRDFLTRFITTAAKASGQGVSTVSSLNGVRCLVAAAVTGAKNEVIQDIVRVLADLLSNLSAQYNDDNEQELRQEESVAIDVLSQIPVTFLTRAQREIILDALTPTGGNESSLHQDVVQRRLALMAKLMEMPNATSKLSSDHSVIWCLGLGIRAVDFAEAGAELCVQVDDFQTISLLEELARLTVKHLVTTQDQERSRLTLLDLSSDVYTILKTVCNSERTGQDTALVLCHAVLTELESGCKQELRKNLPHRDTRMLEKLRDKLLRTMEEAKPERIEGGLESLYYSAIATSLMITVDILATVAELFVSIGDSKASGFIVEAVKADLEQMNLSWSVDEWPTTNITLYQAALIKSFKIICKHARIGDDLRVLNIAMRLLNTHLRPDYVADVIELVEQRVKNLDADSLFWLIEELIPAGNYIYQSDLLLLQSCLIALNNDSLSIMAGSVRYHLLPRLLYAAIAAEDPLTLQRTTSCILIVLKEKPFLNNQHTIDTTLASLPKLLEAGFSIPVAYLDVCQIMSGLLLNHRARLRGRFHLVNKVYQELISKLFQDPKGAQSNHELAGPLTSKHAAALARAITLFCEPLLLHQKSNTSGLTDESRKEQAHVGQYVQYVLHHYCSQVLNGSPGDGVKEALTPGLWAMIAAIEMNNVDGMKSLSASMNNSERAILRGVHDEWKRFGKWRGG